MMISFYYRSFNRDGCICPSGFQGTQCQSFNPCLDDPCPKKAKCTIIPDTLEYQCVCPLGFRGSFFSFKPQTVIVLRLDDSSSREFIVSIFCLQDWTATRPLIIVCWIRAKTTASVAVETAPIIASAPAVTTVIFLISFSHCIHHASSCSHRPNFLPFSKALPASKTSTNANPALPRATTMPHASISQDRSPVFVRQVTQVPLVPFG